jgi:hypothetical protein
MDFKVAHLFCTTDSLMWKTEFIFYVIDTQKTSENFQAMFMRRFKQMALHMLVLEMYQKNVLEMY